MSRFVNPNSREVVRLELSGGDWVEVKKVLTARERKQIEAAGLKVHAIPGDGKAAELSMDLDIESMDFVKLATRVNDWSFKNADGVKVQFNRENLDLLDDASFREIVEAVDKYAESQKQEKNSEPPTGARLKSVGGGSTVTTSQ